MSITFCVTEITFEHVTACLKWLQLKTALFCRQHLCVFVLFAYMFVGTCVHTWKPEHAAQHTLLILSALLSRDKVSP